MHKLLFRWIAWFIVLMGTGGSLYAANPRVKTWVAAPASPTITWQLPALLTAPSASKQAFQVGGKIAQLFADTGDQVKEGDILAQLDSHDYKNAEDQARAGLEQAKANQVDVDASYGRIMKLAEKQFVDASQVDSITADKQVAHQKVIQLSKQVDEASRQLSYTTLRAPFDGTIAERVVSASEVVAAGQPIFVMANEKIEITASLPPSLVGKAEDIASAHVVVPCLSTQSVPAEIIAVGKVAVSPTLTFPVRARTQASDETDYLPGMTALLNIDVLRHLPEKSFILPGSAIDSDPSGSSFIWLVDQGNSTVYKRKIQLGTSVENGVIVTQGLRKGDEVVIAGIHHLTEGLAVTPVVQQLSN